MTQEKPPEEPRFTIRVRDIPKDTGVPEDDGKPLLSGLINRINEKDKRRADIHKLRMRHTWGLFALVLIWIFLIVGLLTLSGSKGSISCAIFDFQGCRDFSFTVSDAVIITFITTTTANILGLYGIAAFWIFKREKKPLSKEQS